MKKKTYLPILTLGVLTITAIFLAGCSGSQIRKPVPSKMPEWCTKQSGVVNDSARGLLVIGVGAISGIKSPAMARSNADGQARTEIAKIFNTYTESMLNLYQKTDTGEKESSGQVIIDATRIFAKMNVRGAAIEDRYVDEKTNTWYSKAVMAYSKFNRLVETSEELSEPLKVFVKRKAGDVFEELDKHAR